MTKQTRSPSQLIGRHHRRKYPWEEWFGAGSFTLIRGVHYAGATHGMAQMIRNAASARGLSVSVWYGEDGTTIHTRVNRRASK